MWRRSNRWSTKTPPKCVGAAAATAIAASDIEAAAMVIAVSDTEAADGAIAVASVIAAMAIAASATAPSPAARSPGAAITAATMAAMATTAIMAAMAAIPPTATPPSRMAMGAAMAIAAAIARPMTITAGDIRRPASSHLPLEEEVGAAKQRPVPTLKVMRSGRDQVVRRCGFFGHQFVAEHAGFFARRLERDDFSSNRHPALSFCLSMIFSENRYPLFRIML